MPTFQHSELLPEHEILQYKIPTATEEANQCSDPEENEAEHGTELYQINDWKYCCKLLILRSARVLARDKYNSHPLSHFEVFERHNGCKIAKVWTQPEKDDRILNVRRIRRWSRWFASRADFTQGRTVWQRLS